MAETDTTKLKDQDPFTREQEAALALTPPVNFTEARRITLEKMVGELVAKEVNAAKSKVWLIAGVISTLLGSVGTS